MLNRNYVNKNRIATLFAAATLFALASAATGCVDQTTDCIGQACVVDDRTSTTDTRTCNAVCTALYQDCGQLGTLTQGYETCFLACTDGEFAQAELACMEQASCDPQDIAQCLEPHAKDLPEIP